MVQVLFLLQDNMKEQETHGQIMSALGEIKSVGEGIQKRLDTLNGSVAKHEQRLGTQDVLNAQITLTQAQIIADLKIVKDKEDATNIFRLKSEGSINTFKWLFGFIGIGTLITLLKVLGAI